MIATEKQEYLKSCELFAALSDDVIEKIAARCGVRECGAGEVLFHEGDHGDTIFFIVTGKIEVYKGDDASPTVIAVLEPPDFFGEMAVLSEGIRTTSCRARTAVTMLFLKQKAIRLLIQTIPNVAFGLFKVLIHRLKQTNDYLLALQAKEHVRAVLHVMTGPQQGKSIRMLQDRLELGSSSGADLPDAGRCNLEDPQHAISRHHAELSFKNGHFFLKDLESSGGTVLNGEPINGSVALQNGDTFRLGATTIRFNTAAPV